MLLANKWKDFWSKIINCHSFFSKKKSTYPPSYDYFYITLFLYFSFSISLSLFLFLFFSISLSLSFSDDVSLSEFIDTAPVRLSDAEICYILKTQINEFFQTKSFASYLPTYLFAYLPTYIF